MRYIVLVSVLALSSCGVLNPQGQGVFNGTSSDESSDPGGEPTVQEASLTDESEAVEAETVEESVPPPSTGPQPTVAALGDPTQPGLWLETPLVSAQQSGQITLVTSGKTANVTLIPIAGESSAGSRLSLEGFQALGAPLTELIELTVLPI